MVIESPSASMETELPKRSPAKASGLVSVLAAAVVSAHTLLGAAAVGLA